MSSLSKYINLNTNKTCPQKKFLNRTKAKLERVKSKAEKKHIPIDTNSIYNKNLMLNSIIDKNMLMNKNKIKNKYLENINSFSFKEKQKITLRKNNLNFHQINNIINKENKSINQKNFSPMDMNKEELKTMSANIHDNDIERKNLFNENNTKLKKNFFDNIKIKNIISLWNELEVLNSYRKYFCLYSRNYMKKNRIIYINMK